MAIKIANGPRKVGNFNHSVIRAFWNKQHWTARATLQRCAAAWKGYYWSQESGNLNNFSKRKKQNKTKPPARCLSSSQRTKKVTEGNRSTWKPSWQQLDEAWGREGITATQLRTKLNWRERERGGGGGKTKLSTPKRQPAQNGGRADKNRRSTDRRAAAGLQSDRLERTKRR